MSRSPNPYWRFRMLLLCSVGDTWWELSFFFVVRSLGLLLVGTVALAQACQCCQMVGQMVRLLR